MEREGASQSDTFGEYANRWYAAQDLAASTMQNYKRHIEEHLLPDFEDNALAGIQRTDVDAWEKKERAVLRGIQRQDMARDTPPDLRGCDRRGAERLQPGRQTAWTRQARRPFPRPRPGEGRHRRARHPADRRAGRAAVRPRRRVRRRGPQGLHRHAVGRDRRPGDGVRPAECLRVEWQLYELDTGELVRCPPKDDSYRDIDSTDWLSALLANHIARTKPKPCPCHGMTYVFRGQGAATGGQSPGAKLVDVARRAEVSTGTVSNVLNRPDGVAEPTRLKVLEAIADLGFVRRRGSREQAAHWRRNGFATWLFTRPPPGGTRRRHPGGPPGAVAR